MKQKNKTATLPPDLLKRFKLEILDQYVCEKRGYEQKGHNRTTQPVVPGHGAVYSFICYLRCTGSQCSLLKSIRFGMIQTGRRPSAWLLRGGLRSTPGCRFSPKEIPAPDADAMIAEYSRKAEDWERMEQSFIQASAPFSENCGPRNLNREACRA